MESDGKLVDKGVSFYLASVVVSITYGTRAWESFLTKLTNPPDLLYNIKKLLSDTKSDRCQLKITKSSEFDRPSVI